MKSNVLTRVMVVMFGVLGLSLGSNAQQIDSFEPPLGAPGERVIIYGTGFAPGTLKVSFNGVRDTTAQATSPTVIYARVPSGATTGPVTVQVGNNAGTSVDDFLVVGLGPYIALLDPPFASPNETILIHGWHLTNLVSVKFAGERNSPNFMANANGTQITAVVPTGATNGPITVKTQYGTSNSPTSFTVLGPGPYVSGFDPLFGNSGQLVSISGANLLDVTNVLFGDRPVLDGSIQGDGLIHAFAPPGVATGPITVRSPKGSFTTPVYFFVPPVISGFSPTSGRAGTNFNLYGSNLLGTTQVTVGGIPASFTATNNTNIIVEVPGGARSGPLRVFTPFYSTLATSSNFVVQPIVTGFAPAFGGPGTSVAISGLNLDEGPKVTFGGTNAAITITNFAQLTVLVPTGAITSPLTVTTTNGTFTTLTNFYLPPVITGFTPTNGVAGTSVTVQGTNFLGTTKVHFGGVEAAFQTVTNNFQLRATVPAGYLSGPITITTPAGIASSSNLFYAPPGMTSFAPTHGLPGTEVTITGTNLTGATEVKFNGIASPDFTVGSEGTNLVAVAPTNATTGKISVTTPGGTATSSANFVIDLASNVGIFLHATPDPVYSGSNLVYQIQVGNAGPLAAPNVVATVNFPASVTVKSNYTSQGSVQVNGREVTASLGTVDPVSTAIIQVTVSAVAAGGITTTAEVSGGYQDPDPSDNTAELVVLVLPLPILQIGVYSEGQWLLSWPVLLSNYVAQYRNTLGAGTIWSNLNTPVSISGTNRFIVEPNTRASRFYRLGPG